MGLATLCPEASLDGGLGICNKCNRHPCLCHNPLETRWLYEDDVMRKYYSATQNIEKVQCRDFNLKKVPDITTINRETMF